MAYRPMSRPDPFDSPLPSGVPTGLGESESNGLENGLSLAEWATALSKHGGGALSTDLALDLVLNEIVEDARLATGATAAAIALARGDEIVCRATTGENAPDLGVRLEVHSGLSGACVQSKKWQRCDDTETDSRVNAEICRELGVRSILVFPVMKEDQLLGVVEIFSPRPNAFSDREIQTLEALSRSIVSNVDRAADVVEPPPAVIHSSPTATAIAAAVASVDSEIQIDAARSDVSMPAVDDLPETTETTVPPEIRPRDHWMTVLTLIVIGLALFLGWMMGYVGRQKAPIATKARPAAAATIPPTEVKPPESAPASPSAASVHEPSTPTAPAAAPSLSQKSGTGVVTAGGLVVYENGKVVFRTPPQSLHTSAKDSAGQPVMVPSKVADEYLIERVEPEYPESAREQHIQGPVVLVAVVGTDGAVEKLSTVKGDAQLASAATDAVRQWRFKPFFRNGSPEEFQTQITVSFRLP
jgi:TonB family protein